MTDTLIIQNNQIAGDERILTPEALAFVAGLERRFGGRRKALLQARMDRQVRLDGGELPDFREDTRDIRAADWTITGTPKPLQDRRVEITGPVDRKMMINAFNCGAPMFMADFEDASSPTWRNMIDGQINMLDYADNNLSYTDPNNGKHYALGDETATLKVRPRGWHMVEAGALLDGEPVSASLFDFGLQFFHCGKKLAASGRGPFYYLPKMESMEEAALWNDVFIHAQDTLGLPIGTIKTTVLIEALPAAFEMDEILHALRDHIVGLNCGRWDYIFSYIKRIGKHADYLLPDRAQVGMGDAFLKAYSLLLIKTCHKRGAHAMGGMAAQIPVKGDEAVNEAAFDKVRADKEREALNGHDGTWVAHPALVSVAKEVFDRLMPQANQIIRSRDDIEITREDLLKPHEGEITENGVRENIRVGIEYMDAWISGRGAVPLYNLMEDAATAEISRTQIWQQIRLGAKLDDGRPVTKELVRALYADEIKGIEDRSPTMRDTGTMFLEMALADELEEFLTTPAYQELTSEPGRKVA